MLLAVDTEAEQESAINRELAHVMCARLDAARRATERLLGVLQVHPALHFPAGTRHAAQAGTWLSTHAGFADTLRALSATASVLQACANAEAAYMRTLTAASKVKLVGDCDGASVRGVLDGFSDLPFMVGQVTDQALRRGLVQGVPCVSLALCITDQINKQHACLEIEEHAFLSITKITEGLSMPDAAE